VAVRWVTEAIRHDRLAKHYLKRAVQHSVKYASGRLLDVGCGRQPYRREFSRVVEGYYGLDLPKRRKSHHVGLKRRLKNVFGYRDDSGHPDIYATALCLPFADMTFDTVLATELLEHLPCPARFLAEAYRVLGPNGILIMTTPFVWPLHEIPSDFSRFTRWGLEKLLNDAGFSVMCIEVYGNTVGTVGMLLSFLLGHKLGRNLLTVYPIRLVCAIIQVVAYVMGLLVRDADLPFGHLVIAARAEIIV